MSTEIEELKEEIEHEAAKVFNAHLATGLGWVVFIGSFFPPAPLDLAIGLPGLLAFVGGAVTSVWFLVVPQWRDAKNDLATLHSKIRSLRKKLRELEKASADQLQ